MQDFNLAEKTPTIGIGGVEVLDDVETIFGPGEGRDRRDDRGDTIIPDQERTPFQL